MRLAPHRHPRASRSGAEDKRTPERISRTNQQDSQKVSKNFLERGDVTEQYGRVAKASRLKSEVYGDEKARRRGAVPAEPLGDRLPLLPPRMAFFHWFYSCDMYLLNFAFSGRLW